MKKMMMLATTAAMIEQFNKNNILILEEMGYEVHAVGNFLEGNPISEERLDEFKRWLSEHHGRWFHIPSTRHPMDKNNIKAYRQIKRLIGEYRYEFIHCHTPVASVLGRIAAYRTHTRIIYTAHGFHFYKGAPLKNWLLYYPAEWICAHWTDVLVTINKEDYSLARKHMHAGRVEYIPGVGIDLQKFAPGTLAPEDKTRLRCSLGLTETDKMLLSVGELIPRKDHETVIRALAGLRDAGIKYYICGRGELEQSLQDLIDKLGMADSVKLLGFRNDISDLCECADLFVFPSLQEGLPVALMEAIASKTPVVCSNIRGNKDLVEEGALFECGDVEGLREKIQIYLVEDHTEEIQRNYRNLSRIDLTSIISDMTDLYKTWGGVSEHPPTDRNAAASL